MVSNRLATSSSSWANIFEKFNCGTYNNQWMILDYNKVTEIIDYNKVTDSIDYNRVTD